MSANSSSTPQLWRCQDQSLAPDESADSSRGSPCISAHRPAEEAPSNTSIEYHSDILLASVALDAQCVQIEYRECGGGGLEPGQAGGARVADRVSGIGDRLAPLRLGRRPGPEGADHSRT